MGLVSASPRRTVTENAGKRIPGRTWETGDRGSWRDMKYDIILGVQRLCDVLQNSPYHPINTKAHRTNIHAITYLAAMLPRPEAETIEMRTNQDMARSASHAEAPVMRSKLDDLSVWQSVRRFKKVGLIAMLAAFAASLDGYRKKLVPFDLVVSRPVH